MFLFLFDEDHELWHTEVLWYLKIYQEISDCPSEKQIQSVI